MKIKSVRRGLLALASVLALSAGAAWAQEAVTLLPAGQIEAASATTVEPGKFHKKAPWKIGMSFAGMGNSWILQMVEETKFAAAKNADIGAFIFTEANWQPAKQVADIEDLIAQGVDALIIGPISAPLVQNQVKAANAAGIPVIVFAAAGDLPGTTVRINGGGELFGEQGGIYLRQALADKGTIWVFRGIAGVSEETARYDGLKKALEGSGITIGAEVFGDWNYAKAKKLCENLVLSGQPVDGIWFSGAEMTRACVDVFKDVGKPLVPVTGEANNGFFRIWFDNGFDAMAPVFSPGLGVASLNAAVALLEGKPVNTVYDSAPLPVVNSTLEQFYRGDLNDAYWAPSTLPDDELVARFKK